MLESRRANLRVLGAALCVLCGPVLVDVALNGPLTAVRYFAADTFYYLAVGRNWAHLGFFTFDQHEPTNGFHPLWQWIVAVVYRAGLRLSASDDACLEVVFALSVCLVALAFALFGVVLVRARGRLPKAFVALAVGAHALVLLPAWCLCRLTDLESPIEGSLPLFGTLWSFMNGMESGLALVTFAALALLFVATAPERGRLLPAFGLGVLAALLTLARLDCVFIAVAVLAAYAWAVVRADGPRARRVLALAGVAFGAPVLAYAVYNLRHFGAVVPVSGAAKSTFPIPHLLNLRALGGVVLYPLRDPYWLDRFYRVAQMLVPACAALVYWRAKARDLGAVVGRGLDAAERFELLLLGTGAGVLALAAYDFFFVTPYGPGHWYFPVSIPYVSIVALELFCARWPERAERLSVPLLACLGVAVFCSWQRPPGYHERLVRFLAQGAREVKAHYGDAAPRLVEFDDGIVAYGTGFPTMSGFGLAVDAEGHRAFEHGRLLELARARGFDRAASVEYMNFAEQDLKRVDGFGLSSKDHTLELDYGSSDRSFGIVRLDPRL